MSHRALIIILSSPSGGGKTSLARALIATDPKLKLSISVTTRSPRSGEQDEVDYYFKTLAEFQNLIKSNAFLEYAKVYNNYYGTLNSTVEEILSANHDVLFDIDCQGMKSIKSQKPKETVSIFIHPPSMSILEERLKSRGQDDTDTIKTRLEEARAEIALADDYDYSVVNNKFENTLSQIQAIIIAERLRNTKI